MACGNLRGRTGAGSLICLFVRPPFSSPISRLNSAALDQGTRAIVSNGSIQEPEKQFPICSVRKTYAVCRSRNVDCKGRAIAETCSTGYLVSFVGLCGSVQRIIAWASLMYSSPSVWSLRATAKSATLLLVFHHAASRSAA